MPYLEWEQECDSCKGTGLFSGFGELFGAAVVCHTCRGTGKLHKEVSYREFSGLKRREGVIKIFATNPGVGLGGDSPGGVSYEEWLADPKAPFQPGKEPREYACPLLWWQSANPAIKPQWPDCVWGRPIYECYNFPDKAKCWERWDNEQASKHSEGGQ